MMEIVTEQDIENVKTYISIMGPACDEDCPGDDTCSCSGKLLHDSLNKVINAAKFTATAPVLVKKSYEWQEHGNECPDCGKFPCQCQAFIPPPAKKVESYRLVKEPERSVEQEIAELEKELFGMRDEFDRLPAIHEIAKNIVVSRRLAWRTAGYRKE